MKALILLFLLTSLSMSALAQRDIHYSLKGSNQILTQKQVDSLSSIYQDQFTFHFSNTENGMMAMIDIHDADPSIFQEKFLEKNSPLMSNLPYGQITYQTASGDPISKATFDEQYKTGLFNKGYELSENGKTYDVIWKLENKVNGGQNKDSFMINALLHIEIPPFQLWSVNDQLIDQTHLKDKITVLNFWFIGCKPCEKEIPGLNKVVSHFSHNPQVLFLAPAWNKCKKVLTDFLEKKPFHYNVLVDADALINTLQVSNYPTHLIIGKEGLVKEVILGAIENIDQVLIKSIFHHLK